MKLSPTMVEAMEYAAEHGGSAYINRRTEDALIARGLITYDVPNRIADLPVVTIAGWAWLKSRGIDRPDDGGRYTRTHALAEAYDPSVGDEWRKSRNSDVCRWDSREGFVPRVP